MGTRTLVVITIGIATTDEIGNDYVILAARVGFADVGVIALARVTIVGVAGVVRNNTIASVVFLAVTREAIFVIDCIKLVNSQIHAFNHLKAKKGNAMTERLLEPIV